MSVETKSSTDGSVTISIRGQFDFGVVNQFRKAYEAHPQARSFCVDMRQTVRIDSSALGMLLNMRLYLGGNRAKIRIINCSNEIRKIFEIAKFEKSFIIESDADVL
ncbi:Anti-anti-sigma regulatory factor (antagonist of anti-sigma factor) [Hahella chejuensis KCTC 2396]|uniref:Anti-anti-sigma regulatory factor (Antagonist of anti-sigma factor) n=1 Tax=Hahella chejuensis (strain KCTC 2396) TaxID=349521 RepID=Q2SHG4_HAHCH|nr:STAS domain-containing protein [Hahella chejuensis]ABC29910.1 Anti-anti-sigma regulatory factor (antagonist of anti-sigma factor) [Hahella chejuensis KCTC 2396]